MYVRAITLAASCLTLASPIAASEIDEIIVTAELRQTPLMQQAASTSVVSAADISQRAAQHLEEVLNLAPNVNYSCWQPV